MGLFGSFKPNAAYDPASLSGSDKMMLLGAMLRDLGSGNGPQTLLGTQQFLQNRQLSQRKLAAEQELAGMYAPGNPGSPGILPVGDFKGMAPTPATPARMPSLSNPADVQKLLALGQQGANISPVIDILKANQPQIAFAPNGEAINTHDPGAVGRRFANPTNVNSTILDLNDPANLNRTVPTLDKGQEFLYDQSGRPVAIRNMDGSVQAAAQMAGAVAGAQEGAKAGLDVIDVPLADGRTIKMSRGDYLQQIRGGSEAPGLGVAQSPGDKTYSEAAAKDSAEQYKGLLTAGTQAPGKVAKYRQIETLLNNFDGGALSPMGLEIASAANSLGFKMDPKWSNAQAADALSSGLALELMGGSLGTGFSNADRDFITKQVPGIAHSAGSRKTLIGIGIAKAQRDQEVATFARKWVQKAGRLDKPDRNGKTFFDYMDEYATAHPLWAK
jgi:hypothetical protein